MPKNIRELTLEELRRVLITWGRPEFHARQIFSWIYKRRASDFSAMSDLPQELRRELKENFIFSELKLVKKLKSVDGTQKFLFALKSGYFIEAVIIPAEGRNTGCVSTQAGCKFGCKFCASGLLGFKRNLSVAEILEEVSYLKNYAEDNKLTPLEVGRQRRPSCQRQGPLTGLTHLVFMGIGEPLDNYENVLRAIRIINSEYAFNIGARRMTISTCGIISGIKKLAKENLQVELSISLHATDEETRSYLLPVNKKYPLAELIKACREYIKVTGRQITFEYVLIKGINSDLQNARILSKILKGLKPAKVNLIPANPIEELGIEPPLKPEILLFRDYLFKRDVNVTLRKPRGGDIGAACGQLRLRYEKK